MAGNGLHQRRDALAFGGHRAQDGRRPGVVGQGDGIWRRGRDEHLAVVLEAARGRVGQLEHAAQRPLGVLHARVVGLVDHQQVGDLQNAGLDRLDVIAHAGGLDHQGGVRQAGDIHLGLAHADRLDQDQVKAGGIEYLHQGGGGRGQPAQRTARRHRADEDARVAGQVAHADAVAQDGAAGEGTGGVHRHHRHAAGRLPGRRLAVRTG